MLHATETTCKCQLLGCLLPEYNFTCDAFQNNTYVTFEVQTYLTYNVCVLHCNQSQQELPFHIIGSKLQLRPESRTILTHRANAAVLPETCTDMIDGSVNSNLCQCLNIII